MGQPPNPAEANSTAQAPVAAPGTSRPDVQTYRAMQSMNARLNAMGSQLQQMGDVLTEQQRQSADAADQAFRANIKARLDSGEIGATDAALEVSEHIANRRLAAAQPQQQPQQPQPPQVDTVAVQQQIGVQAVLRAVGLEGYDGPGLDYSSPQALHASAQRILAARAATQANDHDELVAEAARRQGMVIPHRDGGRAASLNQPVSSADVQRAAWSYNPKKNPPARLRAQLEAMRNSGRVPTVPTGENTYPATPDNFARISSGQTPR